MRTKREAPRAVEAHVRLFSDDVAALKGIATERRTTWQLELRQLVHRALVGERRELLVVKEPTR